MKLLKFHLSIFLITVCLFDLGNLHAQTDDATAILSSLDSAKAIEEANPSVAFRIATRALEKAKDLGDTTLIAQAHALCGNALFSKELFSQALLRYQLALSGFQQNGDSLGIARLEMSIARCEIFDGRYDDAIQRLSKSLNIFKQGGHTLEIFNCYLNLSSAHLEKTAFVEAFAFADSCRFWVRNRGLVSEKAEVYDLLGRLYDATGQQDSAITNYKRAKNSYIIQKDSTLLCDAFINIGYWYEANGGDADSVMSSYQAAYDIALSIGDSARQAMALLNLSYPYEINGSLDSAISVLRKAYRLTYIKANKELKSAFLWSDEFSTNTVENFRLKTKVEEEKAANAKKNVVLIVIVSIAALLLVLAVGIAFYLKKKNSQLKKISQRDSALSAEEAERKRIGSALHDSLGSMLATVKLHFSTIESRMQEIQKETKEQYGKAISLLDQACDEVREISHDLTSGTLSRYGLERAINELAGNINVTSGPEVEVDINGLEKRLDLSMEIVIYRMVQELTANILKHAQATEITIQVNKDRNNLNIIIEDNGIGFDTGRIKEAKGFGLGHIKQQASQLNGQMTIDSTPGNGTTIIVDIKV